MEKENVQVNNDTSTLSINWVKKYLNLAQHIASWSKDPSTKIGAVAVGDKGQILSQGYNGFPRGIDDTDNRLIHRDIKYRYVVHAEQNCIYNATLNGVSLNNSDLYVYGLPVCSECAKGVIQVGVKRVFMCYPVDISIKWQDSMAQSIEMFNEAGVVWHSFPESLSLESTQAQPSSDKTQLGAGSLAGLIL